MKDAILLVIGTAVGLLLGVGIYWWPLGQFKNEWLALWHLTRHRFKRDDELTLRAGIDIKPVVPSLPTLFCSQDISVRYYHDEGVAWYHTSTGWKRARVMHVYIPSSKENSILYRISHLDLKK